MTLRNARRLYIANAIAAPISIALSHGIVIQPVLIIVSIAVYLILSNELIRAAKDATLAAVSRGPLPLSPHGPKTPGTQ